MTTGPLYGTHMVPGSGLPGDRGQQGSLGTRGGQEGNAGGSGLGGGQPTHWGVGWVSPPEDEGLRLLLQPCEPADSPRMAACPGPGALWRGRNHSLYSW